MSKNTKELTVAGVERELNPMLKKAEGLVIRGKEDMEAASEYLSQLNLAKDKVTAKMETITKPAKETVKAAEAVWKPFIGQAKEAIELIREKMSEYQTEQTEISDKKAAEIAGRIGTGKGKLKIETGMAKIKEIDSPDRKVETDSGSVRFQPTKVFEVMDVTLLPKEYILPDEVKIRAAMKADIELPGVKYSIKQVPINSRG